MPWVREHPISISPERATAMLGGRDVSIPMGPGTAFPGGAVVARRQLVVQIMQLVVTHHLKLTCPAGCHAHGSAWA